VLAQVNEGDRQRPRVRPPGGPRNGAGFREEDRREGGRGEVKRGHCRPRIAAERLIEGGPGASPHPLADLDHHPPQPGRRRLGDDPLLLGARLLRQVALLGGPPRGRSGDRVVDRAPEVEDSGHLRGRAREPRTVSKQQPEQRQVRLEEPRPVDDRQEAVAGGHLAGGSERALEADVR
jgi:hypothetical protein